LQIKRIETAEVDGLRSEWNDLLDRSACGSVFLRWEWIRAWWGIFKQDYRLFILTARQDSRLCGIAPFYIDPTGPMGLRTLKFCSEELSPDHMDVIAERGQETAVAREMVNTLVQSAAEWDVICLDNLSSDSILLSELSLFRAYSHSARVSQICPYIKIQRPFER
jgi:CelD/BcsL family acetyltransferase involved in cellulose biosynthesis